MNTTTSRTVGQRGRSFARPLRRALAAAALALAAAPLWATTNRLVNPDFDTDVVGWDQDVWGTGPLWDVEDRNACPGSGSAFLSGGLSSSGYSAATAQWIPVSSGESLYLRGEVRVTLASSWAQGMVSVWFCGPTSCATPLLSSPVMLPFDAWTRISMPPLTVPADAQWASVGFFFRSPDVFDALVDRAFASNRDEIFGEGFEPGGLCRWSGHAGLGP